MQSKQIEGYRISPQQKHLWLLQQGDPDQPYRAQCCILLEGVVSKQALRSSLQTVVERQEILQTTFQRVAGMQFPVQVIRQGRSQDLFEVDLVGLSGEEQEARLESIFTQEAQVRFDLEQGPLMRALFVMLATDRNMLLVSFPALCMDSKGMVNLVEEISYGYASVAGLDLLPEEALRYVDISEWQNQLLEAEDREAGREYWRDWHKRNRSALASSSLPFESRRSGGAGFAPGSLTKVIPGPVVRQIAAVSQSHDASTQTFLLACWQILLWRLAGGTYLIVAAACDSRKYEEMEDAIGLLTSYLPLDSQPSAAASFSEMLGQVNRALDETRSWQEYFNWEQLAAEIEPDGETGFFPFTFDMQSLTARPSAGGVTFSIHKQYVCSDRFKLRLSCVEKDGALVAQFHFDKGLFSPADIERLAEQFQTLVTSAIHQAEAAIDELQILSNQQKAQLLNEFSGKPSGSPEHRCIHELFEQQAERKPQDIAVVYEGQQLTYSQLNGRANQLARYLRELGAAPDVPVAICVERSLEMIVALLGVLKSGAAYMPLDPQLPRERLSFMLTHALVATVLTQASVADNLPSLGEQVFCLDRDWPALAEYDGSNFSSGVEAQNLAYVIYTSGSTGNPKAVAIEHQQLLNYVNAILDRLVLAEEMDFATVSTFAADLGNTVIFPSLCAGGRLHIISQGKGSDPDSLGEYFQQHKIDCLKIVPSHLAALLSGGGPERVLPRERLILGGEASRWDLIESLKRLAPELAIYNHYGPTETTVGVLVNRVDKDLMPHRSATPPLGRPIAGAQIYLLDSHLEPVPVWAAGWLYVGGESVGRGYLNSPGLTAERYLPDPFAGQSGSRLYDTGDMARWLPDGKIEFLGRVDDQVKIRGIRIELGEIEAALRQHPSLQDIKVMAREDSPGERRLVAYVIPRSKQAPALGDLRDFLAARLPDYMVPSSFVALESLPLTLNGKVDLRALPPPEYGGPDARKDFVSPRNEVEKLLAEIWAHIMGLDAVGIHDNFFELGGDSILGIRIIAKANQAGLKLVPRQLFQHQTVAALAAIAESTEARRGEPIAATGSAPLTPIQHWFFEQDLSHADHWNQAILLQTRADLAATTVARAIGHLFAHHDALRSRFTCDADGWRQTVTGTADDSAFMQVDLSLLASGDQKASVERAAAEMQKSLSLAAGPMARLAFFYFGPQQANRLLIIIHHLIFDGVSWRILLEDLQTACEQIMKQEAVKLPGKTTSYKEWAERLVEYARSSSLPQEAGYWLDEAKREAGRLPRDYADGENVEALSRRVAELLDGDETRLLLQEVPTVYRTQINDILLTALVRSFAEWTGSARLLVEMEGHGREEIIAGLDLSRTVGWFTSRFGVLLDLSGASGPGDAVKSIKEQLRAIPHRGIGYGILRYLTTDDGVQRRLANLPEPEISFNYLGQFDPILNKASHFKLARESSGPPISSDEKRKHLLDINATVVGGRLRMIWTYSEGIYKAETVAGLAASYTKSLRSLISHCRSAEAGAATPADFPLAKLNQQQLDSIFSKVTKTNKPE